ncbi:MAG TPA: site-specific integrase [Rhodocyclaceae bacterium]|nr:site-specific integrase [Rhodocyclaceae bacterium]
MEHVIRRGAVYTYRRRIPLDLVAAHGGKREVTFSLGTKNRAEAAEAARRVSVRLDAEWKRLRREAEDTPKPEVVTAEEAAQQEAGEYWHGVEAAEEERREEVAQAATDRLIATMRAQGLVRVGTSEELAPKASGKAKAVTLESLIEHWKRESKPSTKAVQAATRTAVEFDNLHKDPSVQKVTRAMVIEYRDWLLGQNLKAKTINGGRLAYLSILLGVALDRSLVSVNHALGTALPEDDDEARTAYSPEQAATILKDTEQYKDTEPVKYWLPRLAKYTGARLNELHQLRKSDLEERDGYRGIRITDKGECMAGLPMKLKNTASRRWVPLHAEVVAFWDWAQGQPDGALFPAKADMHGTISATFSKWYGRQRAIWGIQDKAVVFHSWRHRFADECRIHGVRPEVRMALMGHAEGGTAGGYGSGELPAKVLADAMRLLPA